MSTRKTAPPQTDSEEPKVYRRRGRPPKSIRSPMYGPRLHMLHVRIDGLLRDWVCGYAVHYEINISQAVIRAIVEMREREMRDRVKCGLSPDWEHVNIPPQTDTDEGEET